MPENSGENGKKNFVVSGVVARDNAASSASVKDSAEVANLDPLDSSIESYFYIVLPGPKKGSLWRNGLLPDWEIRKSSNEENAQFDVFCDGYRKTSKESFGAAKSFIVAAIRRNGQDILARIRLKKPQKQTSEEQNEIAASRENSAENVFKFREYCEKKAKENEGSEKGYFYYWCENLARYEFYPATVLVKLFENRNFNSLKREANDFKNAGIAIIDRNLSYAFHAAGNAALQVSNAGANK